MSAIITNKLRIFNAQQYIESVKMSAAPYSKNKTYNTGDSIIHHKNIYINVGDPGIDGTDDGPIHTKTEAVAAGSNGVLWLYYSASHYNNIYLGIGNSLPWFDDSNPPTPSDSVSGAFDIINNLTAIKKVGPDSITLCVPRIDWESGTVYEMYDDYRSESIIPNGYVLVSHDNEYRVYKCINNSKWSDTNGVVKVASTVKPTLPDLEQPFETSDGYIWRYMYSIYLFDALKYLTKDYMPVKFLTVDPLNANSSDALQWQIKMNTMDSNNTGRIDHVRILPDDGTDPDELAVVPSGGSGYLPNLVLIDVNLISGLVGGSTSSGGFIPFSENVADNSNYNGYGVFIKSTGNDSGEWRTITSSTVNTGSGGISFTIDAQFVGLDVSNPPSSVIIAPIVWIDPTDTDGYGFSAYGVVTTDRISGVEILNKGINYTFATIGGSGSSQKPHTLTLNPASATILSGVSNPPIECRMRAIISPQYGHGFNPVEELGGYYAMVAMKLEYDEQNSENFSMFPVDGDESVFRQVSIISDPIDAATNEVATDQFYRGPNHPEYSKESATHVFNASGESTPLYELCMLPGRGRVLYIENRQPVSRAIDQIEDIKVVFEF